VSDLTKVLIIHGPNLNLLGRREITIYGSQTLDDINEKLQRYAASNGIQLTIIQSNSEGDIINQIHKCQDEFDFCVINPGAFSHYSIAIRDAITAVQTPFIEVHLTNISAREPFRWNSVVAPVCMGSISGFSDYGYQMALHYIHEQIM
jgi:3-dehydroquinate dehydratase II